MGQHPSLNDTYRSGVDTGSISRGFNTHHIIIRIIIVRDEVELTESIQYP